ncbi:MULTISPECIES: cupin domain-containing protein [unclassified Nocardia]|uniref:cupin domain-containing protein n=1 Tax=unclassified Nocardia TaxID=2637762 RepID=UPI001CE49BE8|nr:MULTISPECIES: cupin domain-containing protein [unclassified Nocardia]
MHRERGSELGQYPPIAEWAFGCLMVWHQLAETTGGMLAAAEVLMPKGGEPPVHVHSREDEMCHILDGAVTVRRGPAWFDAGPGTSVWLPRGIPHGFAVRGATVRMLRLYTPAGVEKALRTFGTAATDRALPPAWLAAPAAAEVAAEFARYGVTVLGVNRSEG